MQRAHHDAKQADAEHKHLYHWLANQLKVHPEAHISGALAALAAPALAESRSSDVKPVSTTASPQESIDYNYQMSSVGSGHIIIILGVYAHPDGTPSAPMQARIDRGHLEALRYPQAKIVVTGAGVGNTHIEAEVMARELLKKGVDGTRIIVEPLAQNTISNATRTWLLLPRVDPELTNIPQVTVVTEPYHLVRALRIFSQLLSQVSPTTILRAATSQPLLAPPSRRSFLKLHSSHQAILGMLDRQAVVDLCRNVEEKWRITYGW